MVQTVDKRIGIALRHKRPGLIRHIDIILIELNLGQCPARNQGGSALVNNPTAIKVADGKCQPPANSR